MSIYDGLLKFLKIGGYSHPTATVNVLGGSHELPLVGNYGFYSYAPTNSWVFVTCDESDNTFYGIADDVDNRPENLAEGDVVMFNTVTKDFIHIANTPAGKSINVSTSGILNVKAAQAINVTSTGPVNVTAPTITLSGTCAIGGAGGPAIARVGDSVQVNVTSGSSAGTWSGTITSGGSNSAT